MHEFSHLKEEKKKKKRGATYTSQSTSVKTNSCLLYLSVCKMGGNGFTKLKYPK